MIGLGMMLSVLFKYVVFRDFAERNILFDFFVIIPITVIIWEGNLRIDRWLNQKYSWIEAPKKRTLIHFIAAMLFTSIMLFILMAFFHRLTHPDDQIIDLRMRNLFLTAMFVASTILALDIGYQFFTAWRQSLIEVEKYKTESANAQLQNLKNQLNPHFLFNNLSVLSSLVYINQDKAIDFIHELSKVYRYVLDNKGAELVPLQEELDFLSHYIYLLKIRFESSISFEIQIEEAQKNAYLPPMCLQTLVENTIQHNEASQAKPLRVSIYTKGNVLMVENPIQPRSDKVESSQTGLKNIRSRYSFFTEEKMEVSNDGKYFKISLPLIHRT
jgi:two-component system LytT family sensor kinase